MDRTSTEKRLLLLREMKVRNARKSFYDFCCTIHPKFFKPNRTYLKSICDAMEGVYFGTLINPKTGKPYKKLALSVPPLSW